MRTIGILLASIFLVIASAFAGGKTVHVHGYYRKDGTYVHAYNRAAPGSTSSTASISSSTTSVSSVATPPVNVPSTTPANVPSKSNAPVFIPAGRDPARRNDPDWVPAKIVNGQYVPAHFKHEEKSAASSTTTTRSSYNGVPHTQPTYTSSASVSSSLAVQRDAHGRIKRSETAEHDFMRMTGYPNGRPGYVVDHIIPLKRGGCDCPSNMQWQTIDQAKSKDKWE
jgi:hypothetical protein